MSTRVESQIAGSVWKVECEVGAEVEEDDVVIVLESMKMEIPVEAPEDGRIVEMKVSQGDTVEEGDLLFVLGDD